jgi:hypothetical protein
MMWYMTAKPYRVSVLHIKAHDPGRGRVVSSTLYRSCLWRVLIFLTLRGHLTLVVTFLSSPHGMGSQAIWSALGPINMSLPFVQTTHGRVHKCSLPSY